VKPELSIVLPVRNQADHIAGVLDRYRAQLKGHSWEIILVPNASTDNSLQICRKIAKKNRNIRLVENPKGGWGLSVRMGLETGRGRFLAYANSARTDPATLLSLWSQARRQPDTLFKVIRLDHGGFLKNLGSGLYNLECRLFLGVRSRDVNGTPKIFPAGILKRVRLSSDGDLLDAELLAHCRRLKVPVVEVPLREWRRHGGKSTTNLKSAFRMYRGVIGLWWRIR
jgi:glycosyltransferase involved in cell wall biosynthesis